MPKELSQAEINKLEAEAELFREETKKNRVVTERTLLEMNDYRDLMARQASVDQRNRVLNFLGVIMPETVAEASSQILAWDRQSREPISLRIMSPGGDVVSGICLYDLLTAIRDAGTPISTIAMGAANSVAAVVLQAGGRRVVGPNAWITMHEVSGASGHATVTEQEEQDKFMRRMNTRLVNILASRSKLSAREIGRNIKKTDWTIEPEEAIALGFADEIGYK